MNKSELIAFRVDKEMQEQWSKALAATGVSSSELGRRCVLEGFAKAVSKLIREREQAIDALTVKESKRPFELPASPFTNNVMAEVLV